MSELCYPDGLLAWKNWMYYLLETLYGFMLDAHDQHFKHLSDQPGHRVTLVCRSE